MGFRDIKLAARAAVQTHMAVPGLYFPNGLHTDTPVRVHVRLHYKMVLTGEDQGTRLHYAQVEDITPKIIFQNVECEPDRNAVVMFAIGEGYRVDNTLPVDLNATTAVVVPLLGGTAAAFDYPGSVNWPLTSW